MNKELVYRGTVTEYATQDDVYGVVSISITVQNSVSRQPPVNLSDYGGKSVRVTLTVEHTTDE